MWSSQCGSVLGSGFHKRWLWGRSWLPLGQITVVVARTLLFTVALVLGGIK